MTQKAPTMYPRPGTHAEKILTFVSDNPGASTNRVISKLSLNPSVARKCLAILVERGLLVDSRDDNGFHHYTAKGPAL